MLFITEHICVVVLQKMMLFDDDDDEDSEAVDDDNELRIRHEFAGPEGSKVSLAYHE